MLVGFLLVDGLYLQATMVANLLAMVAIGLQEAMVVITLALGS
jgi:hypothetical protein